MRCGCSAAADTMAGMTPTPAELLALRHRVPDSVLLDWLDLDQLLQPPCKVTTADLTSRWHCSQSMVSRRLKRLWEAELLDYRTSRGGYRIRSLGPCVTDCNDSASIVRAGR